NLELMGAWGVALKDVEGLNEIGTCGNLRRDHRHNGYVTQAPRACIRYGFDKLHAKQVICMIRPVNRPSRRVAERNGMAAGKLLFWHDFNHLIYSISREQWFVAFQKEREAEKSRKEGADGDVSVFLDSV